MIRDQCMLKGICWLEITQTLLTSCLIRFTEKVIWWWLCLNEYVMFPSTPCIKCQGLEWFMFSGTPCTKWQGLGWCVMFSGTPCTKCEGLGWVMFLKHPVLNEGLGWTRMVLYFLFVEAPPPPPSPRSDKS